MYSLLVLSEWLVSVFSKVGIVSQMCMYHYFALERLPLAVFLDGGDELLSSWALRLATCFSRSSILLSFSFTSILSNRFSSASLTWSAWALVKLVRSTSVELGRADGADSVSLITVFLTFTSEPASGEAANRGGRWPRSRKSAIDLLRSIPVAKWLYNSNRITPKLYMSLWNTNQGLWFIFHVIRYWLYDYWQFTGH